MTGKNKRNKDIAQKRYQSGLRKAFSLNIGTIIFGAIFIYIIISILLYITANHVTSYQVTSGPLAKNQTYTALAVRSESVVTADTSGYITYYAREDAKIKKSGVIYGIGSSRQTAGASTLTDETLSGILKNMRKFSSGFSSTDFHDTYTFKYEMEGEILGNSLLNAPDTTTLDEKSGTMTIGDQTINTAAADGVITYSTDGYEDFDCANITADALDEKAYVKTDLKTSSEVKAGDQIYKLVNSEKWSIVIPLTARQIVQLDSDSKVRVKFLKDGISQVGDLTILTMTDGKYYGKIDFTNGMIRYVDDRFLNVELVTNKQTGLKIPVSSIVNKTFYTIPDEYATVGGDSNNAGFLRITTDEKGNESTEFVEATLYEHRDGKYYVDTSEFKAGDVILRDQSNTDRYIVGTSDTLEGVYSMNKGYAVFRKVVILDKNEEYCIVEKGTDYGIAQFDYIVLDSSQVKENEITAKR